MSKRPAKRNSCFRAIRRLFCCATNTDASPQRVDPGQMHSIVLAPVAPQAMETVRGTQTQLLWKTEAESDLARETLRLTTRSEPNKALGFTATVDPMLLSSVQDAADTQRNPVRSFASDLEEGEKGGVTPFEDNLGDVRRLKYRDLPTPGNRPPFPLKPVTPHGKTRIPTARPRLGLILESLQREEASPVQSSL